MGWSDLLACKDERLRKGQSTKRLSRLWRNPTPATIPNNNPPRPRRFDLTTQSRTRHDTLRQRIATINPTRWRCASSGSRATAGLDVRKPLCPPSPSKPMGTCVDFYLSQARIWYPAGRHDALQVGENTATNELTIANCRFEHPAKPPTGPTQNRNAFSVLGNSNQNSNQAMGGNRPDYRLDAEAIRIDLSSELPKWILSCYGPGRDTPIQLFGGMPREQSFEEIRLAFMEGEARGNAQGAVCGLFLRELLENC